MMQQTIFPFRIETTKERLTAHGGLALMAEFDHGIGLGMERMPCGQSYANAVFFRIGVISYNLFIGFKRLACPESWVKQTIATFRWKMVQVAGRIVRHAGERVLKLMIDLEKLECFKGIRRRSYELSLCPDG